MQLSVTGLAKHYGDSVVFSQVSLQVNSGEFVAIVGESGVGKSTLLNCLAGLDHWDQGTVLLDGQDLGRLGDEQINQRGEAPFARGGVRGQIGGVVAAGGFFGVLNGGEKAGGLGLGYVF
jgi:ABC-type transporter Mla maintaining outer membrane lipid asymmetry ATPase subunit MlaF